VSVILRKNKRIRYSQIIGSLMYLASATRLDILFAVSKLNRFVSNLGDDHRNALERVMNYLSGTTDYGIHYIRYPRVLEGYNDSNWIIDVDKIKATSAYVFTLGGGVVTGVNIMDAPKYGPYGTNRKLALPNYAARPNQAIMRPRTARRIKEHR
jgi:hypothetical protein